MRDAVGLPQSTSVELLQVAKGAGTSTLRGRQHEAQLGRPDRDVAPAADILVACHGEKAFAYVVVAEDHDRAARCERAVEGEDVQLAEADLTGLGDDAPQVLAGTFGCRALVGEFGLPELGAEPRAEARMVGAGGVCGVDLIGVSGGRQDDGNGEKSGEEEARHPEPPDRSGGWQTCTPGPYTPTRWRLCAAGPLSARFGQE